MQVAEVILEKLKREGKTKQWLALQMELSYSTLHQKLTNNTFTAEEFVSLCMIFQLDVQNFIESKESEGVTDLSKIPIASRPDVAIEQMKKFKRGGIGVESQHENGSLIYFPYGLQDYLGEQFDLLVSVKKTYENLAHKMREVHVEEGLNEEAEGIENQLVELEYVSGIIEYIIQTTKEN